MTSSHRSAGTTPPQPPPPPPTGGMPARLRQEVRSEEVRRDLLDLMAERRLPTGTPLPGERELAAAIRARPAEVRGGLRDLELLGVVEPAFAVGRRVVRLAQHPALVVPRQVASPDDLRLLRQATAARALVEVEVAARAAGLGGATAAGEASDADPGPRRSSPVAGPLADVAAGLDADEDEPRASRHRHRLDFGFEEALAEAVADPCLRALQALAHRQFAEAWDAVGVIPRCAPERARQHRGIFAAVLAGDAERAAALMRAHVAFALPAPSPATLAAVAPPSVPARRPPPPVLLRPPPPGDRDP